MTEKDPVWPIVTLILALLLGMRAWWRNRERERQLAGAYLRQPDPEGHKDHREIAGRSPTSRSIAQAGPLNPSCAAPISGETP